jgi:hypothetical protein
MRYFDLIYLVLFNFYSNIHGDKPEGGSACFIFSGLKLFNLITLYALYYAIFYEQIVISKFYMITLYVALCCIFYFRYIYYESVMTRVRIIWENTNVAQQKRVERLVLWYVILTVVCFVATIYYWASKH